MIQIPTKLQTKGIKFVLLEKQGKKPFQQEWQNKVIEFDNKELLNHNGNYGVMGGGSNNLLIIDFDNEKIQEEVIKKLPETFSVKTGRGMLHKYFFSDKAQSFKIFDEEMNTLADVQGEGKQVVGAGSIHPNGNKYEIVDDKDIVFLSYGEIKALLMPYDKKPKKEFKEIEKPKNPEVRDDFIDKVKNYNSMSSVLSSFGVDASKNPTACPFHSSKGGKCLGFNRDIAHCFHCDNAWNIFSFVKDIKRCSFKEALEYLCNLSGLQDELEINRKNFIEQMNRNTWEGIQSIDSFFIYEGSEKIYDIIIDGKKIRLEGKEIMDYNIFRLKYFETFGIMLPTFRGIMSVWATILTSWNKKYGKIIQEKTEDISESDEAKQLILDYINNCSVTNEYVIKEGIVTNRESFIYVPTKIIKKILRRESITISMRKLAYLLDNYIASGSIPFKIENRSERFWKFYACKFDIKDKLEIENE